MRGGERVEIDQAPAPRRTTAKRGRPAPDAQLYSILEVSNNPSDQWPKYATFVIAFGLLIHFVWKLITHVRRQQKKLLEGTS